MGARGPLCHGGWKGTLCWLQWPPCVSACWLSCLRGSHGVGEMAALVSPVGLLHGLAHGRSPGTVSGRSCTCLSSAGGAPDLGTAVSLELWHLLVSWAPLQRPLGFGALTLGLCLCPQMGES